MHLILTSDLRAGLGRLWEHGEMLILGSSPLAAITSSQQVVGGQRKERGSRKQRGIKVRGDEIRRHVCVCWRGSLKKGRMSL